MTDTTDNRALVERIKFEAVNGEIDRQLAGEIIIALTAALDEIERLRDAAVGVLLADEHGQGVGYSEAMNRLNAVLKGELT